VGTNSRVTLLPIGPGEPQLIPTEGLEHVQNGSARFLPDGVHIVLNGNEPTRGVRGYRVDVKGGKPKPVTPEGMEAQLPSPDGQWVLAQAPDSPLVLCSLQTGEIRPIPGIVREDNVAEWTPDSKALYVYGQYQRPVRIERLDLKTGTRSLVREIFPSERFGVISVDPVSMTRDASEIAFSYYQNLTSLYIVNGLR